MIKIRSNKPFELVGVTSTKLEYEESAKRLFEILVYSLPCGVTERVMEIYKKWDEYTDDWNNVIPPNSEEFFEILKALESGDDE